MSSAACERARADRHATWSVGYLTLKSRPPTADEKARGVRRVIQKWAILEISSVRDPAGAGTGLLEVRCD